MKKHSIFALISMGVTVFALTGCSLARTDLPDQGMEADRLIGVFLTTEYLDLFDMEGYLANHPGQLLQDGEIGPEEAAAYQRRLYADKVTRTITNEDTGATEEVEEYVFEGVQGWAYLAPALTDEAGERISVSSSVDDALSGTQMNAAYTDEGESLTLEATLYLTGEDVRTIYVNPVYQSADGSVYATNGNGYQMPALEEMAEGEYGSATLDSSSSITADGTAWTEQVSVTIHLAVMHPPEEIRVLQMEEAGGLISSTSYTPGEMPWELTPEPGCAYLIVETHSRDAGGGEHVSRQLAGPEEEMVQTYYLLEDGVCAARETRLLWPQD